MGAIYSIDRVELRVVRILNHLTSHDGSLALRMFDLLQLYTFRRGFVLHIDWIVGCTPISFHANFVLLAHAIVSTQRVTVLIFHELPSLNISLHLGQASSFNQ